MSCRNARTPRTVVGERSCSAVTSNVTLRSGVKVVPAIGANVRSGGSQVPATIEGENSSAPGAISRWPAPTVRRSVEVGAIVRRARGLNSAFSM